MKLPKDSACRILIVDDSVEDAKTYQFYLSRSQSLTCEFDERRTIEDGLRACREFRPHCILLDYLLPDGDGLDFLEQFGKEFPSDEAQVILLTGWGDQDLLEEALLRGAAAYLTKGKFDASTLCQTVYRTLEKGRQS